MTGTNSGSVGSMNFTSIENLSGGTADDVFRLGDAGLVNGTIDGGREYARLHSQVKWRDRQPDGRDTPWGPAMSLILSRFSAVSQAMTT